MSVFAERLKNLRYTKGQTQGEVGKALGKSREAVSKYEIGQREPDTAAIAAIAKYFNVSADYILGITNSAVSLSELNTCPYPYEITVYDAYLRDYKFIPYLKIAVKMKDNKIEIVTINTLIDNMIKAAKQKRP